MIIARYTVLTLVAMLLPVTAWAQGTSDFTVRVFGGADTAPPTTPVLQTVTPVASSQVDVTWSPATDDLVVLGYVVSRDGVPVATTTALTYSDTGLATSTTYSYSVTAFDATPNYSTSSTALATTTLGISAPQGSSSGGSGTRSRVQLQSLTVDPGVATATMSIDTTMARVEVRVGTTNAYELAYIVGSQYKTSHSVPLYNLSPDTQYFYEVVGYTQSGRQTVLEQGSFRTLTGAPPPLPTNVGGLTGVAQGDDVRLTYQLPFDMSTDAVVRVVRSHYGYPQFVTDGVVVYEGRAQTARDDGVLGQYATAYYTVFVIDPTAGVSSGAVTVVSDSRSFVPLTPATPTADTSPDPTGATATVPVSSDQSKSAVTPAVGVAKYVAVEQGQVTWSFASSTIALTNNEPFAVSVPSGVINSDTKTIVATLYDPRQSGKQFSFLLRLNADRSAYTATIAPLQITGVSDLIVEIFDYDARVIETYKTTVTFTGTSSIASSTQLTHWYWRLQTWLYLGLLAVPFLVALFLWFVFWRRDAKDDE